MVNDDGAEVDARREERRGEEAVTKKHSREADHGGVRIFTHKNRQYVNF